MTPESAWLTRALLALTVSVLLLPAHAVAQGGGGDWTAGEDNEFGSIRGPYEAKASDDEDARFQYRVVLNTLYEDRDTRYFVFMASAKGTPLEIRLESLVTESGGEIEVYEKAGGSSEPRWTVDVKKMPEPGTPILMEGTVTGDQGGMWQMDAMVIPFTYRWEKVHMANGLEAKLQAITQVNVGGGAGFCGEGGCGAKDALRSVPGPALLGPAAVAMVALALRDQAGGRRRG